MSCTCWGLSTSPPHPGSLALTELHVARPQRCSLQHRLLRGQDECRARQDLLLLLGFWSWASLTKVKILLFVHVPTADAEEETPVAEPGFLSSTCPTGSPLASFIPKVLPQAPAPACREGGWWDCQPQASAEPSTAVSSVLHLTWVTD